MNQSTEIFVNRAKLIHGNKYDYSKAKYKTAKEKLEIICEIHGSFLQTPDKHINGAHGCKKCGFIETQRKQSEKAKQEFASKANSIHNNKFDYSKVKYINTKIKIEIICPEHGTFWQDPDSHVKGVSCPECSEIIRRQKRRRTNGQIISECKKVWGDMYEYKIENYQNNHISKIQIFCKKHGWFTKTFVDHVNSRSGCNKCSNNGFSKMAIDWLESIAKIENINIQHGLNIGEYIIPGTRLKVDGYCKETNTIYEFHGDYWHGNPKLFNSEEINGTTKTAFGELYRKTLEKEALIKNLGYNLIVIWESDWKSKN